MLLQEAGKAVIIRKDDIRVMNAYINRDHGQSVVFLIRKNPSKTEPELFYYSFDWALKRRGNGVKNVNRKSKGIF